MYKVMLVDDDYPVIELLSESIRWEELGLCLMGTHENGWNAWEHARLEMPDILITDIGMPRMNGLELSSRMKELKPEVRIAILSCHNEFQYAQQAMRLNVQDYLLKDALDPEDLVQLLRKFKESLDEETKTGWENSRIKHLFGRPGSCARSGASRILSTSRCFRRRNGWMKLPNMDCSRMEKAACR